MKEHFSESDTRNGILRDHFHSCSGSDGRGYIQTNHVRCSPLWLTPQEATALLDETTDVVVIDLSSRFYDQGHLPGAVNYPKDAIPEAISDLDKDATYIVYSHWTGAPLSAAALLKEAGFKYVYALKGNFGAWADAGYPVE